MSKYLYIFIFLLSLNAFPQKLSITGTVSDTVAKTPLVNSVVMAVKVRDSLLVKFIRTDDKGFFKLDSLPIDTYQVVLSNPLFSDQIYFVLASEKNHAFDFGRVVLPPKSITMNEVVVMGYKDKMYYHGDTLVYTADSFKVKQNAVVEDLLKKLPGIRVDAKGKVYSQGKVVDQVLVDGDEFFGSDPTVATKNLAANAIESVQVYDKKNENPTDKGDNETMKIMNLKLKEESKKGYFGKISGAGDFNKFYEGELLANRFRNKFKLSVFGLTSNTPTTDFSWEDTYKYGLNSGMHYNEDDQNEYYYGLGDGTNGLPKNTKTGFYYTDRWSKKTKVAFNYTYLNSSVSSATDAAAQYFLSDTTYKTKSSSISRQKNESHTVNFILDQTLDSLTELRVKSTFVYNTASSGAVSTEGFYTDQDTMRKNTAVNSRSDGTNYNLANTFKLTRNFKKRDRRLVAIYNYNVTNSESEGILQTSNTFYDNIGVNDTTDQQKNNSSESNNQMASITYTEPFTKKIKLELSYDFNASKGIQNKKTLDFFNGEYTNENALFSNNFENKRQANRVGAKFIYEIKRQRFVLGSRYRVVSIQNNNLITSQNLTQRVENVLPYMRYRFKFSDNESLDLNYSTDSRQPSLSQLQPVPDNSSPNYVISGNPNLLPTFDHSGSISYNTYKPVSGKYIWTGIHFNSNQNDFSSSLVYDSTGRATYKTINVDGNIYTSLYGGGQFPLFSRFLILDPNINCSYAKNNNYINGIKNVSTELQMGGEFNLEIELDSLNFSMGMGYTHSDPSATVSTQSNKPYNTINYSAEFECIFKKGFAFTTQANYYINSKRAEGYNINYFLWNASLAKTFFKSENMILSVSVKDILNQNISASRSVQDNVITDTKTNIIGRYFLLKLAFKFNSNKEKQEDEEF